MLIGSFDNGDPNTTNLYIGNINPKVRRMIELKFASDFFQAIYLKYFTQFLCLIVFLRDKAEMPKDILIMPIIF